jgi:uncharacterized protein
VWASIRQELHRLWWHARTWHWFRYTPQALQLHTQGGNQQLWVEVARTRAEQNFGLSYRKRLPSNGGMLFVYPHCPVVTMWMHKTYLSLDMVFINPQGRVAHIAANLQPHTLGDVTAACPTWAVLELAGGTAARLGLAVGDSLSGTALQPAAQPALGADVAGPVD